MLTFIYSDAGFLLITFILLIISLINFYFFNKFFYSFSKIVVIMILIVFYGLGMLRSHDTIKYYIPYYLRESWREFEPLYTFFNLLGYKIGLSPHQFIFLITALFLLITFIIIEKILTNKKCFLISIYFLFTSLSFNFLYLGLLRQATSLSIVLIGIYFFINNKKNLSFIFILLACLTHYFTIIFFLIFILQKIRLNINGIIIFTIILSCFATIFSEFILLEITKVIINIFDGSSFAQTLERIIIYKKHNVVHSTFMIKYVLCVLNFILFLIVYKYLSEKNSIVNRYIYSLFSLIIASSITYFANETSIRILFVFNILIILGWLILYQIVKVKEKEWIVITTSILMFIYSLFSHAWVSNFITRIIW